MAVGNAGGRAVLFPVIDIVPRDAGHVAADVASLPEPDIVIFVSRNAVAHGHDAATGRARLAAVGDATAAAVRETLRRDVDILPAAGFDSEALLAETALRDVCGRCVRIVRGDRGRELLADVLRERGARVDIVSAYARRRSRPSAAALTRLADDWQAGRLAYVVAMSVASFDNLLELLPAACRNALHRVRLVTPSSRVIQTSSDQAPEMRALLATGPGADDLVAAMAADWQTRTDTGHE
ncbi:MAG: uroporphyrinogen-III synthase [Woeseiaceae bacterium]|nr:uroporphyrinogen-III synthase [Woeseiaceae bacterium]